MCSEFEMYDSEIIIRLYETVLQKEICKFHLKEWEIQKAIVKMVKAYAPEPSVWSSTDVMYVNYNDPASRCAYLHKYASFHTALVAKMLERAFEKNPDVFLSLKYAGGIELCSLGGGPGSDVIGILAAFSNMISDFKISTNVLDCMKEWKETFDNVIQEIRDGEYGSLSDSVWQQNYNWNTYIETDLYKINNNAHRAIASANLITMVKFVSAAACEELHGMIRNIFSIVKPGALILYIDNDHHRYHGILRKEAKLHKLQNVIKPFKHEHFTDTAFKKEMFRISACFETTVSVYLWQKPFTILDNMNFLQPLSINLKKSNVKFKKSANDSYINKVEAKPKSSMKESENNILKGQNPIKNISTGGVQGPKLKDISNFFNKQSSLTKVTSKSIPKSISLSSQVNHLSYYEYSRSISQNCHSSELNSFQSKLMESTQNRSNHDTNSNYLSVLALKIAKRGLKTFLGIVMSEFVSLVLLEEAFEANNSFEIINTDDFMNHLFISL